MKTEDARLADKDRRFAEYGKWWGNFLTEASRSSEDIDHATALDWAYAGVDVLESLGQAELGLELERERAERAESQLGNHFRDEHTIGEDEPLARAQAAAEKYGDAVRLVYSYFKDVMEESQRDDPPAIAKMVTADFERFVQLRREGDALSRKDGEAHGG